MCSALLCVRRRLSASALPGVEVNALRATLGVRPAPQPVAGALRGVMHCTGPLEHPVFSGTAVAVPLPAAQLLASEDTPARHALLSTRGAVGGFDRVPITSASAVFTLDTSTQRFTLHSAQVRARAPLSALHCARDHSPLSLSHEQRRWAMHPRPHPWEGGRQRAPVRARGACV